MTTETSKGRPRPLDPESKPDDRVDNALRPQKLSDLIGQNQVKENLAILIAAARQRGDAAHRGFYEESSRLADRSAKRGKCFIATLALGEGPQTQALRQFRDLYLRRTPWGRAFVGAYYRYSPIACDALAARPRLLMVARGPLRLIATAAGVAVRMRLRKDSCHGA